MRVDFNLIGLICQISVPHSSKTSVLSLNYGDRRQHTYSPQVTETGTDQHHIVATSYGTEVFSVGLAGDITASAISIGNGTLSVDGAGLVQARNLEVLCIPQI